MAIERQQPQLPLVGPGARLKAAREAAGLSRSGIAEKTRISERMIILMEDGDFAGLPAKTYATGFTRSYARALGLDEEEYVAAVRSELGIAGQSADPSLAAEFEPGDPARVPSARLAWLAALAAAAALIAGLVFWRSYYAPAVSLPSILPDEHATAEVVPTIELETEPAPTDPASMAPLPEATAAPAVAPVAAAVAAPAVRHWAGTSHRWSTHRGQTGATAPAAPTPASTIAN